MSKKVFLLAHEALYGGGTRQTFYLAQALIEKGAEVSIVSNAKTTWLGDQIKASELKIGTFFTDLIQREIEPFKELKLLIYLVKLFKKEKPDLILASGVKLMGLASLAGFLANVPERWVIIRGEGAPPGSKMLNLIYFMERFIALLGTKSIAVSDYIKNQRLNRGISSEGKIVTVHDGTDVERWLNLESPAYLRNTYGLKESDLCVGMVGRLVNGKAYDQFISLIEALCAQEKAVYGFLVGEGENREDLEKQISQSPYKERIFITGFVKEMSGIYADLDLAVLLTDYEGCPNSVLESMASAIPTIASDVCGIAEIIDHGKNGYLISPDDLETAIACAKELLLDPDKAKNLADNGREIIRHSFNKELQLAKLADILLSNN